MAPCQAVGVVASEEESTAADRLLQEASDSTS